MSPRENNKMDTDIMLSVQSLPLLIEYGSGVKLFAVKRKAGKAKAILKGIRLRIAQDYGFEIPEFGLRLNSSLQPSVFQLKIFGSVVLPFGNFEAENSDTAVEGYLLEAISNHLHEIFNIEALENLLEKASPKLGNIIEEALATIAGKGPLLRVFQNLLREKVSIRRVDAILAKIAEQGQISKDADFLHCAARSVLSREICSPLLDESGVLNCFSFSPLVEQDLNKKFCDDGHNKFFKGNPDYSLRLLATISRVAKFFTEKKLHPVLLTASNMRQAIKDLCLRMVPDLIVLGYSEIPVDYPLNSLKLISDLHPPKKKRVSGKEAKELYAQAGENSELIDQAKLDFSNILEFLDLD